MDLPHLLHLVFLSTWAGVVLAELAMEITSRDIAGMQQVARQHLVIDVLIEVPLLVGVLITGTILAARLWPLSTLHLIKIGCALVAIGANLACVGFVLLRYRRRADPAALSRLHRWVRLSALGIPFGLVAAYLGLRCMGGLLY